MKQKSIVLLLLSAFLLLGCKKNHEESQSSTGDKAEQAIAAGSHDSTTSKGLSYPSPSPVEQSSLGETRKRIASALAQLIGKPQGGLSLREWRIVKEHYWHPSFDGRLAARSPGSGIRNLLTLPPGIESPVTQVLTGKFTDITDPSEQEALLAYHLLAMVTAGSGGASMPAAVIENAQRAEVTKGDLILFEVFNDAFVDISQSAEPTKLELDQWMFLARSPNDLYRLLALRTFRQIQTSPEQLLAFYRLYVGESDRDIIEEAVGLVIQIARPEAASLLAEIGVRANDAGNVDLVARLDKSIEWLRSLPVPPR